MSNQRYLEIHDAIIWRLHNRIDHGFCIFLPWNKDNGDPTEEDANRLTERTGIKHCLSKVTGRIYFVATLGNVDEQGTFANSHYAQLSSGDTEWQVSNIRVYHYNGSVSFNLCTMPHRPFCFRKAGDPNAKIYPKSVTKWPGVDDDPIDPETANYPDPINPIEFEIKKVIFSNPCTIVFWGDGTKTVVRCSDTECYDPEKGIAMALMRKVYGPRHRYMKTLGPYIEEFWKAEEAKQQLISAVGSGRLNFADILRGATSLFTGKHIIDKVADKTAETLEEEEENDENQC